jgi:hypothetical protein
MTSNGVARAAALATVFAVSGWSSRGWAGTSTEIWPELDLYLQVQHRLRLALETASHIDPSEGSATIQAGGRLELSIAPLREMLFRTIQPSKQDRATLAIGYRYGAPIGDGANGASIENRLLAEATFRLLLPWAILASDRNRFEARDLDGAWSWRYRNRLELVRGFDAGPLRLGPVLNGEASYDSRYDAWSRLRAEAGVELEHLLGERSMLELFVARERDEHAGSTSFIDALGITLELYR